jgi:carbon-monoxide dehydrogenase medium subunit
MKPVNFDYVRPTTLAAAIDLLAAGADGAKAVAGTQSLGPMLNLRLVQPDLLVDVTAIPELLEIRDEVDRIVIGAAVTHARIEDGNNGERTRAVLAEIAAGIAYRAVRNRGTIGGSLAHADPAADWLVCTAALGAEFLLTGTAGPRTVRAAEFVVSGFETVLAPDELIVTISVPRLSPRSRWAYFKVCRKKGEFAEASAAVLIDDARGFNRCVIGATSGRPIVIDDMLPLSEPADNAVIADALSSTVLARDPVAIQMHTVAVRRAVMAAMA